MRLRSAIATDSLGGLLADDVLVEPAHDVDRAQLLGRRRRRRDGGVSAVDASPPAALGAAAAAPLGLRRIGRRRSSVAGRRPGRCSPCRPPDVGLAAVDGVAHAPSPALVASVSTEMWSLV